MCVDADRQLGGGEGATKLGNFLDGSGASMTSPDLKGTAQEAKDAIPSGGDAKQQTKVRSF